MAINISAVNNGDAFVVDIAPNTNYGGNALLYCYSQDGTGGNYQSYLNFTLPSGVGAISAIALFLYCQGVDYTQDFTLELHQVTSFWSEMVVTYNLRPCYSGTILSSRTLSSLSGGNWYSFDISSYPGITWGSTVSLVLLPNPYNRTRGSGNGSYFPSRDGVSNKPYVQITYTPSFVPGAALLGELAGA